MRDTHDERRAALQPEPPPAGLIASIRNWIAIHVGRRQVREQRQAQASESNRALREAEARRALRQPGVSPEAVDKAMRVLARIGKGEA